MKTADIEELTNRVRALVAASKLGPLVKGVEIEPAESSGDQEVLRVHLRLADLEHVSDEDASKIIDQIVDALWDLDDRFPSVWLDEAA